jgi:hypothetical protein
MLGRLQPSLTRLDALVGDLRPGAVQLRVLAPPLSSAIVTLGAVAPQLDRTLRAVQRGAPAVTRLLGAARPVLARLRPALSQLAPMVGCVRPYAPELAGFFSTWQSMGSFHDAGGHYGRVQVQEFPFLNDNSSTPAAIIKQFPTVNYSLIRPPGYSARASWLQPQCGAGTAGLDPTQDPEVGG